MAPKRALPAASTPYPGHTKKARVYEKPPPVKQHKTKHIGGSCTTPPRPTLPMTPATPARTPFVISSQSFSSVASSPFSSRRPSTPFDSPSNPVGLHARHVTSLPKVTRFSQHYPLRFVLTEAGSETEMLPGPKRRECVKERILGERVVQVPLNYTFKHLHALIQFLFFADTNSNAPPPLPLPVLDHRAHLFEAYSRMYASRGELPGVIRSGRTWAQLSSVRDPFRVREARRAPSPCPRPHTPKMARLYPTPLPSSEPRAALRADSDGEEEEEEIDELADDEELQAEMHARAAASLGGISRHLRSFADLQDDDEDAEAAYDYEDADEEGDEDEGGQGWEWYAEEDLTLRRVWPKGADVYKGVIYHHTQPTPSSTSPLHYKVHLTISRTPVPGPTRRGISNTPHVFYGTGTHAPHLSARQRRLIRRAAPALPQAELGVWVPAPEDMLDVEQWNADGAFARFVGDFLEKDRQEAERDLHYSRMQTRTPAKGKEREGHAMPTPGPSSPPSFMIEGYDFEPDELYGPPSRLPVKTPLPPHFPIIKRRHDRVERRLSSLARQLEEEERREEEQAEVDELAEDIPRAESVELCEGKAWGVERVPRAESVEV